MEVKELFSRLKKEAECSICVHTVNQPKSLPCLHSFCLDCLNKYAATKRSQGNTAFGCPECSAIVNIPDGDRFDDFPTSFYINRLVDILALENEAAGPQNCTSCDENLPAASFCLECKDFLCSACLAAHSRTKFTRGHRQASLRNLAAGDVEELIQRPVMCERPNHKQESLEYYCQDCKACICLRCCATSHNKHDKLDIADAADQHKAEITQRTQEIRERVAENEQKMDREKKSFECFQQQVKSSRDEVQAAMSELYRILKEYETSFVERLDDLLTQQQEAHAAKLKNFELSLAQMTSSVDHMEAIIQRNIGAEILSSLTAISERSEEIMQYKSESSKIPKVNFVKNGELCEILRQSPPGFFHGIPTDPSSSTAEGEGLHGAQCGETAEFTVSSKDADGELCYSQQDRVSVRIRTAAGREVEAHVESNADGRYRVTYTPMKYGESLVTVRVNGHVLRGSPWRVHVTLYGYKAISSFDSLGSGRGKFGNPGGVAVSSKGNVVVTDSRSNKVHVFNSEGRHLNEVGSGSGAGQLTSPTAVAYADAKHILVVDNYAKVLLFKENGKFIEYFSPVLLRNHGNISVTRDGHVIACKVETNEVTVVSRDGNTLLRSFGAPDCDSVPWSAVQHQDKFFVCYPHSYCIKVFDSTGRYIRNIGGGKGTGAGQFEHPRGVTIDKYNNLVVADWGNKGLQIFTPEGEPVSVVGGDIFGFPFDVASSCDGQLYVTDRQKRCVHILRLSTTGVQWKTKKNMASLDQFCRYDRSYDKTTHFALAVLLAELDPMYRYALVENIHIRA